MYSKLKDVTEKFGISKETVYRYVKDKRIPHYWLGPRILRFDLAELETFFQAKQKGIENDHQKSNETSEQNEGGAFRAFRKREDVQRAKTRKRVNGRFVKSGSN